ncbi:hypothetical protein BcDW1_9004 [Botrytis cinerea BcDW1]|uniref:Uncharacterized protein n=1 Tax=Botryotinia fuckeliana (strain BcDW1) TaxID=1290391 RepID=M7TLX7_BOTF1|nr:hypothetical protein BcDW1_9004 [Botrytis cinerea BcDW1]
MRSNHPFDPAPQYSNPIALASAIDQVGQRELDIAQPILWYATGSAWENPVHGAFQSNKPAQYHIHLP